MEACSLSQADKHSVTVVSSDHYKAVTKESSGGLPEGGQGGQQPVNTGTQYCGIWHQQGKFHQFHKSALIPDFTSKM